MPTGTRSSIRAPAAAELTAQQYGKSLLIAGLVLAIMIIPVVSAICREVFLQVPGETMDAASALGATKWEMIRTAVLPFGRTGMISAAMLGLGRALGETIAVALVLNSTSGSTGSSPSPAATRWPRPDRAQVRRGRRLGSDPGPHRRRSAPLRRHPHRQLVARRGHRPHERVPGMSADLDPQAPPSALVGARLPRAAPTGRRRFIALVSRGQAPARLDRFGYTAFFTDAAVHRACCRRGRSPVEGRTAAKDRFAGR